MTKKLIKSTMIISALTMISRILGLIRDMVILSVFGTGGLTDAFLVAFKIPNFLRRLFAEGAFSQAFVPVLSEYKTNASLVEIQALISRVSGVLLLLLSALTGVVIAFAPYVISVFAIGFHHDMVKFNTATELLRITFPYLLFISMTAFASSILQSYDRFAMPAFAPVLLNISMIFGAVVVAPYLNRPIMALGYAVAVAGILQLLIQLPDLYQQKLLVPPKVDFGHEGVQRILSLMLPAIFGVSVTQINLLTNTVFATFMPNGSVSWLYAAERMSELPLGLIGVAIGTVILPSLSVNRTNEDYEAFQKTLDWALKLVVMVGLPAATALWIVSNVLMIALFQHGQFNQQDTLMSGLSLQFLSGGILGFMLIKVFAPAFFAHHDSRTPVRVGVIAMVSNIIFSLIFMYVFKLANIPMHASLALANTLASLVNAGLLYYHLHHQAIFRLGPHWRKLILQFIVADIVMAIILAIAVQYFPLQAHQSIRIGALLALCFVSIVVYAFMLKVIGFKFSSLKH